MSTLFGTQITNFKIRALKTNHLSEPILTELSPKVFSVGSQLPLPLCIPNGTNYIDLGRAEKGFPLEEYILIQSML